MLFYVHWQGLNKCTNNTEHIPTFYGGKKKELHSLNSIVAKFMGEKITDSEYLLYIPLEELPLSRHYGVLD